MSDFKLHTAETVPEAAKETLDRVEKSFGMIPNLAWVMAEAPALLKGYFTLNDLFAESSFSAGECQVISLCISHWNQCHYCVPAHSFLAKQAQVAPEIVTAIREDKPLPEEKWEALRRFIYILLEKRGYADEADLQAFYQAGFTLENVLEVILGIGLNILSNYTNHIAKTPIDGAFAKEK
jgi:uncharacterized peroxidase-related enzyme